MPSAVHAASRAAHASPVSNFRILGSTTFFFTDSMPGLGHAPVDMASHDLDHHSSEAAEDSASQVLTKKAFVNAAH